MPVINQHNLFVTLFLISTSVSANALPWQGPYAGIYLGGGFGNNHMSTNAGNPTNTSYFTTSADINAVQSASSWQKKPERLIAGLRAGHDWSWNQIVYGAVLDYGTFSLSSSTNVNSTYPDNLDQYSIYTSMSTNWLFTLRGRLGYQKALSLPCLFYFTGGMAMTKLGVSSYFNDNSLLEGMGSNETSQNQIGWAAGAGIDVAALKHVTVNIEYLYINIPSVNTMRSISNTQAGFGIPEQSLISPLSTIANFHANLFKIGFNYQFDE